MPRKPKSNQLDSSDFDRIQEARANITPAEYLAETRLDSVPPGWYRSDEVAAKRGIAGGSINRHIRGLRAKGQLEERKYTIRAGSRIMPVLHYRLTEEACKIYGLPLVNCKK